MKSLRRIFNPTEEEKRQDYEFFKSVHKTSARTKGCTTCEHCVQVRSLSDFVTGEECECTAELECDTVLFTVKNCPKWSERPFPTWAQYNATK